MSRVYKNWTKTDIDDLVKGKIPESHPHHAACHLKAKSLGFTFHKAKIIGENWTPEQIDSLRQGVVPEGKSWNEAVKVAKVNKIDFVKNFNSRDFDDNEIKLIKDGHIPPHRDREAVIKFAATKLNINVFKTKRSKKSLEAVRKGEMLFKEFAASPDSLDTVAKKHGMSKQNAHRLIQNFKVYYFDTHFVKECVK